MEIALKNAEKFSDSEPLKMQLNQNEFDRLKTLRLSLTAQCNLRCIYCTEPAITSALENKKENQKEDSKEKHYAKRNNENQTIKNIKSNDDLNFHSEAFTNNSIKSPSSSYRSTAEILRVVESLHKIIDFNKIRITGGEPTLSKNLLRIVKSLSDLGINDIRMTTNGIYLKTLSEDLVRAGLKSVNISLDALDPKVFHSITGEDVLPLVLNGIEAALNSGLEVKLNTVLIANVNETEIIPILEYAMQRNIIVRYLELMAMGHSIDNHKDYLFPRDLILKKITEKYNVTPLGRKSGSTASLWSITNKPSFGIISNYSDPFCMDCDRLRMDAHGKILGCIGTDEEIPILSSETTVLKEALHKAIEQKEEHHFTGSSRSMKSIGG